MKNLIKYCCLAGLQILLLIAWNYAQAGSSYTEVHDAVFNSAYQDLPAYEVNSDLFGPSGDNHTNLLLADARRTLTSDADLLDFPAGRKLLQPNGICFSGEWIMGTTPYTGMLASGVRGLAIVRASVSLGGTRYRDKRAFSMAVKIFPTLDYALNVETRNLLVMESIAGSSRKYFHEAVMDNEPPLGGIPALNSLGTSLRIYKDMQRADTELSPAGANLTYRPVSSLAVANDPATAVSPRWIRLMLADNSIRIREDDFRNELNLSKYPGQEMTWVIEAADGHTAGKAHAEWQTIGSLKLDKSITSPGCDLHLHFAHPVVN